MDERGVRETRQAIGELVSRVQAARDRCAACEDPAELRELFVGAAYFERSRLV